tara:strand:- start:192 stop:404 length:213 start_codon:yes stop_codon:yes gene_type:complete
MKNNNYKNKEQNDESLKLSKYFQCCICENLVKEFGNNPEPLMPMYKADGQQNDACDSCTETKVREAREAV